MVEYRPIPDERDVFHEYRSYAFRPESGVPTYDPDEHETPRATLGSRRGLYDPTADDTAPRTVCRHYWLETHVRGEPHRTAGLASVATPPEYRHSGYVRRLLANSLAEYRDRDVRFSVLWPFRYRFYRQYGWDTANSIVTHECAPTALEFATGAVDTEGTFRRLEADEYDRLEQAYDAHAERYGLALERDEQWWRRRVFAGHDRDPFVYAVERDGEVRGYLVYTIDDDSNGRTMAVSELVAVDHDALLALLAFCHRHDSQIERVRLRVPGDVPIRDIARDPDEIDTVVEDGPMVRIVDVAETLSACSAPALETDVTIAVDDPLADWNDGTFRLEGADGRSACTRLADSIDPESADIRLDVAALSQLVVGSQSAPRLERTGRLTATDSTALKTVTTWFPETDVYLGEYF
ncbi:GNAT family N-acetyltransferase [Natronorubrum thiooxidans]|uniref:Predicted acetyltransferase n=1 Tax=Natronorubrum thiooxidans TaxID=308853 RepID=A0A1N7EFI3_9EURY|nr:GNAT family N-acetyltransferase [Natronorubrum thiooxidans]SIR86851.1 Predicted acetyltransferase [Natronorubrum thiooxidans]